MEKTADETWLSKHGFVPMLDQILDDAYDRAGEQGPGIEHDPLEIDLEI